MGHVFHCYGHGNIRAKHPKTIEFTRDAQVTPRGDCIIGVRADYDLARVKDLAGKVRITVEVDGLQDRFFAMVNPDYDDDHEMVFRRSGFRSKRTLGVHLNKGAVGLQREIVQAMKDPEAKMTVTLESIERAKKDSRGRGEAEPGSREERIL